MKKLVIIILLITCVACNNDDDTTQDPIFCTDEARAGLEVTVRDGIGGAFLTEGVAVIATDNEYQETLENFTGSNAFFGAFERTGIYIITATKSGYTNSVTEPVVVEKDACHVITESVEIILEKQ
ncbi:hypothetical protein U6A24_16705 [Aquimarina gracilis]|uniref:Carboxypeptidase regulatory-like domain-containing protein n=1 Tax=Aquimarina gracilis TaxID=874422 RepID=A0ABU5ZZ68_9FLAO|nr:hypothetical protein [Aquimarina gracilis]MEB3347116.1 hypothetical protein [Aquimarina gracilis]